MDIHQDMYLHPCLGGKYMALYPFTSVTNLFFLYSIGKR